MHILQITPASSDSRSGNRTTAERWAQILESYGHRVTTMSGTTMSEYPEDGNYDACLALHAFKSAPALRAFRRDRPQAPIILALTGTDLYRDLAHEEAAQQSLELADRLVCLHDLAHRAVPARFHDRLHVIFQSVEAPEPVEPREDCFEVCVAAHLREVKDPLRAARAARLLPESSRLRITHVGGALEQTWQDAARKEIQDNPRYDWIGDVPRQEVLRLISRSRALVLTSRLEGGANVVGEAIAAGTPVLSSRIDGSLGLLGDDYPGYFPVGDTQALAGLLAALERDDEFRHALQQWCADLQPRFERDRERAAWGELLAGLT